jgi:hypothetical protein
MGVFGNQDLNTASNPSGGGLHFECGTYEFEITKVYFLAARDGSNYYMVETLITKSNNPSRPVGCKPTWMQKLNGDSVDVAPQTIRMFCAAASCLNVFEPKDERLILAEDWNAVRDMSISDDQPMKGFRVHADVTGPFLSKKKQKPFHKFRFTPPEDPCAFQLKMIKAHNEPAPKS